MVEENPDLITTNNIVADPWVIGSISAVYMPLAS